MSETVSVKYASVPTVKTAAGLKKAARLLTTSHFACRLNLKPRYLETFGYLDHVDKYNDPVAEGDTSVDYQYTFPGTGGLETTFAIPTNLYDRSYEPTITQLLREHETDPRLVKPDSFHKITLKDGRALAFTLGIPKVPEQPHYFRSLSPTRKSAVTFLDGRPGIQDPYGEYVLSLAAIRPQE